DQMVALALMLEEPLVSNGKVTQDSATGLTWRPAELEGWVSREGLVSRIAPLWDYGKALYQNECVSCHVVFSPSDFWATQWENKIHDMQRKIDLTPEQTNVMLRYLQHHAKPQGEI
ncbi:MAG: hypothetical protein KJO08_07070, partial [Gammaproteobacteria bacterium]|nr:hypothetical protein [Gammaproteobacteria bacterium]